MKHAASCSRRSGRLGYIRDVHARHLASRDRRTLGIIVSDIENPFFPEVIKSFETRARQLGYDVILSDTNYDPRRTREAAERMMEHKVRGVAIMTSEISLRLIHELARRMIAVTFLDLAPVRGYTSNLRIDYLSGIEANRELSLRAMDTGTSPSSPGRPGLKSNLVRLASLRKIDAAFWGWSPALSFPEILRFEGGLAAGRSHRQIFSATHGRDGGERSNRSGRHQRLAECRLPRAEDISVTGFDKTRLADYSNPSITTVDIHRETLGHLAADALHELSSTASPQGKEYQIGSELVIGNSSGPAPR